MMFVGEFIVTVILAIFAGVFAIIAAVSTGGKTGGGERRHPHNNGRGDPRPSPWGAAVENYIRRMYKCCALNSDQHTYGESAGEIAAAMRADGVDHAEFVGTADQKLVRELAEVDISAGFLPAAADFGRVITSSRPLADEFVAKWRAGEKYFNLLISTIESVAVCAAGEDVKDKMLQRWHSQYTQYMHADVNIAGHSTTCYALDQNLRWSVKCSEFGVGAINNLQEKCARFMRRALDGITGNIAERCQKLANGMRLYADKPNLSHDTTWTTDEYNMAEFQYTYIRLKSLQRYTECYSAFEVAFGGVSDDELRQIRRVASIGGGCGFELFALADYISGRIGAANFETTIIDVAETWSQYADLIGCEYLIEDVNMGGAGVSKVMAEYDLVIFSYVYRYLTAGFFTLAAKSGARMIFNERKLPVSGGIPAARRVTDNLYVKGLAATGVVKTFIND